MKFKIDEITSVIQQEISQYKNQLDVTQVGKIIEVGDGIARIYGLRGAMAGEMLEFPEGIFGQVFNLEEESIGAVVAVAMPAHQRSIGQHDHSCTPAARGPRQPACSPCRAPSVTHVGSARRSADTALPASRHPVRVAGYTPAPSSASSRPW